MDFPGGSDGKVSAYNPGSIPGLGRSSGEGNGNPLQYSGLENPMVLHSPVPFFFVFDHLLFYIGPNLYLALHICPKILEKQGFLSVRVFSL